MDRPNLPAAAAAAAPSHEVSGVIERVITEIPMARAWATPDPVAAAERFAREAARNAALLSASLALPPGPVGMLTVLPDLYLIWKLQRQLVADIFALHGRTAELTRSHMLYCLFRHLASQVLRDVVVRAGERALVRQLTSAAMSSALGTLGITVAKRLAGTSVGRWVPLAGAAAVGAYAYWDTMQVAKTARRLLEDTDRPSAPFSPPTGTGERGD